MYFIIIIHDLTRLYLGTIKCLDSGFQFKYPKLCPKMAKTDICRLDVTVNHIGL